MENRTKFGVFFLLGLAGVVIGLSSWGSHYPPAASFLISLNPAILAISLLVIGVLLSRFYEKQVAMEKLIEELRGEVARRG